MKHSFIISTMLLISGAIHANAMIPVVDGGSIAQLASQTTKLGQQLVTLKDQLSTLTNIYNVNEESKDRATDIMNTLGTTQQFKENNQQILGQLGELSGGMNLGGTQGSGGDGLLGQVGSLFGGGGGQGGGGLLEGFAGLTEPLAKVSQAAGTYGSQAFDIFSSGKDIMSTAQGMMDGSTGVIDGVISIAENIFGGGGSGMQQRMNEMSVEEMLRYGNNTSLSAASMWNQAMLSSAKKNYEDQLALAQQRQKVRELSDSADTANAHLAAQNQISLLQAEQQAQALNLQAQGSIAGAASQEAAAQIRKEEQVRAMGKILGNRY